MLKCDQEKANCTTMRPLTTAICLCLSSNHRLLRYRFCNCPTHLGCPKLWALHCCCYCCSNCPTHLYSRRLQASHCFPSSCPIRPDYLKLFYFADLNWICPSR